ncbi:unnamed protein product [Diatraea saccharalis]|uniref:Uncharacterized protein n=1 Tax=Diatraea saccharalis TaxID=40085 RepID=A0A9P0G236_9NEOP|nr:unnamed protein product [Diatraea saccharalis]
MADSSEAPQSGDGDAAAPPVSPPKAPEADKVVDTQTVIPADQLTQVINLVTEETKSNVTPPALVEDIKKDETSVPVDHSKEVAALATVEQTKEVIAPVVEENKREESTENVPLEVNKLPEAKPVPSTVDQNSNSVKENTTSPKQTAWQERESELLKKIEELEKVKNEQGEDGLKLQLKVREEEIDLLKARVKNLETELQAALSKPGGKNHEIIEKIKQQHEELLSKAKGMIFDKTKMVKNQELQIEALNTQVQSLKDINLITKDLLEIRNSEVKAMEERLQAMEARFKTEKERYGLVLQRAQTSSNINDDLKKEYETQLAIFKELREKYEQRVKALVAENERLKESVKSGATGDAPPSGST